MSDEPSHGVLRADGGPSGDEPRYPYVVVNVCADDADDAGALLFELGALGVELRDGTTMAKAEGPRVTLIASFENPALARAAAGLVPKDWSARVDEVLGDAWRDEWKKYFEPFRICGAIFVRPPWRDYQGASGDRVIVLEPGRAFGTGLHETTQLVAEVLSEHAESLRGSAVLDVGCGSGILSLVALALGAATARAIDVDPDAVHVTRENAERNALSSRVHVDQTPVAAIADRYRTVVANIEAAPLVQLAAALVARVAAGGRLVLSGILAHDVSPGQWERVRQAYGALRVEEIRRKGEWIAAVLRA
jgi:ribosomal protein L11 methyltransferase